MPNTALPTNVTVGSGPLPDFLNTTHGEINRMSRSTGWARIPLLNGWKVSGSGFARIRREDDRGIIQVQNIDGTEATSNIWAKFSATDDGQSVSTAFRGIGALRSPLMWAGDPVAGEPFFFSQLSDNSLWCSKPAAVTGVRSYEWWFHVPAQSWPSFWTPWTA